MKYYDIAIRLLLSMIIGGAVGFEREHKNRPAGLRTHILVCIGAAVISMIQTYTIQEAITIISAHSDLSQVLKVDAGRMGAQVISGIGFLGAGTILHEKGSVKGLTTAASIWVVACIGLSIGAGYYTLSILSTVCVVIVLVSLKRFEDKFIDKTDLIKIEIEYCRDSDTLSNVAKYFSEKGIKIQNIEFNMEDENYKKDCKLGIYSIQKPKHISLNTIVNDLKCSKEILNVALPENEMQ